MGVVAAWDIGFSDKSVITIYRDGKCVANYDARGQGMDQLVRVVREAAKDAEHVVFLPEAEMESIATGKTLLVSLQERVVRAKAVRRGEEFV